MEDEKEEQRVTKSDREEKMREKKGKRGKVALQHFLGNEILCGEKLSYCLYGRFHISILNVPKA